MSIGACAPLVLASASRARQSLLQAAGLAVMVDPAEIDEDAIKADRRGDPAGCAAALAVAKALAVAPRHQDVWVIGADQTLDCEGETFDKPRSADEARRQLMRLRGTTHRLHAAAVVTRDGAICWRHVERAELVMRRFSEAFLDNYLAAMGARVVASVGAYELEGLGVQLFERIEGDYFAILGLPLLPLLAFLRSAGAIAS